MGRRERIFRAIDQRIDHTDIGSRLGGDAPPAKDQVERIAFEAENVRIVEQGGKPAEAEPVSRAR